MLIAEQSPSFRQLFGRVMEKSQYENHVAWAGGVNGNETSDRAAC